MKKLDLIESNETSPQAMISEVNTSLIFLENAYSSKIDLSCYYCIETS